MFNNKLSFLSNNVKGIKVSEKRLKLFEYFRNYRLLWKKVFQTSEQI